LTADTTTEDGEAVLRIGVTLPAGAYATSLMREIMKEPQALNLD